MDLLHLLLRTRPQLRVEGLQQDLSDLTNGERSAPAGLRCAYTITLILTSTPDWCLQIESTQCILKRFSGVVLAGQGSS